jgi:hypothetical protein
VAAAVQVGGKLNIAAIASHAKTIHPPGQKNFLVRTL